jgi:hypothetical protein
MLDPSRYNPQEVTPELANYVAASTGNGAWVLGAIVELIPNTEYDYPIQIKSFESGAYANPTADVVAQIYTGEPGFETLLCEGVIPPNIKDSYSLNSPAIPANTRVSIAVADEDVAPLALSFKLAAARITERIY